MQTEHSFSAYPRLFIAPHNILKKMQVKTEIHPREFYQKWTKFQGKLNSRELVLQGYHEIITSFHTAETLQKKSAIGLAFVTLYHPTLDQLLPNYERRVKKYLQHDINGNIPSEYHALMLQWHLHQMECVKQIHYLDQAYDALSESGPNFLSKLQIYMNGADKLNSLISQAHQLFQIRHNERLKFAQTLQANPDLSP